MTQVSPTVRVEDAKATKVAVATPELLASLAPYYQPGGRDALGAVIAAGEQITYRDVHGPAVWRVYRLDGPDEKTGRYQPVSDHPTEAEALAAAQALEG